MARFGGKSNMIKILTRTVASEQLTAQLGYYVGWKKPAELWLFSKKELNEVQQRLVDILIMNGWKVGIMSGGSAHVSLIKMLRFYELSGMGTVFVLDDDIFMEERKIRLIWALFKNERDVIYSLSTKLFNMGGIVHMPADVLISGKKPLVELGAMLVCNVKFDIEKIKENDYVGLSASANIKKHGIIMGVDGYNLNVKYEGKDWPSEKWLDGLKQGDKIMDKIEISIHDLNKNI